MSRKYQIQITPDSNQTYNTPTSCSDVNYLLTFALFKWNSSSSTWVPDNSSWYDLQIEVGDKVTWVWLPGSTGSWPTTTSLAWLLLAQPNGAQICENPDCTQWSPPKSLASCIDVNTGTLNQNQSLPAASACSGYGGKKTFITPGSGQNSNTITIQGRGSIEQGHYLKLTYAIWFKTDNFNYTGNDAYWFYDPEVDVKPSASPSNVQS